MLTVPPLQVVFEQISRKIAERVPTPPQTVDYHLPGRIEWGKLDLDTLEGILVHARTLVTPARLSRAERKSRVMILKNYCGCDGAIGSALDVDLLGAFIERYGTILGNAADVFGAPVMDIKVGIATIGWLCQNGELDSNAVQPGIGPAEKMPVQCRPVAENEGPVAVNASRSAVNRRPFDPLHQPGVQSH